MPDENKPLLDAVNAQHLWFHAKKTRPIWVRQLDEEETVQTCEGEEHVPAGSYRDRGEAGGLWPQNATSIYFGSSKETTMP